LIDPDLAGEGCCVGRATRSRPVPLERRVLQGTDRHGELVGEVGPTSSHRTTMHLDQGRPGLQRPIVALHLYVNPWGSGDPG